MSVQLAACADRHPVTLGGQEGVDAAAGCAGEGSDLAVSGWGSVSSGSASDVAACGSEDVGRLVRPQPDEQPLGRGQRPALIVLGDQPRLAVVRRPSVRVTSAVAMSGTPSRTGRR
jgi:hypothetical protein